MNEEDFVTFDVATALKEKGFKGRCLAYFNGGKFNKSCFSNDYNNLHYDWLVAAPTLAEASKWLREKHNIHVEVTFMWNMKWGYVLLNTLTHDQIGLIYFNQKECESYEESLDLGLKEALNMI